MSEAVVHVPVMVDEVLQGLRVLPSGAYLDCTLGSGGHSAAILGQLGPAGRLLALDRDAAAVERAGRRLAADPRLTVRLSPFSRMEEAAREAGFTGFDGILIDCGVSSDQLAEPARGFSFQTDGPLDMRMSNHEGPTAAEWLGAVEEEELCRVLRGYGEEPDARRVARALTRERASEPLATTLRLAEVIERAKGGRRGARTHPATRAFQAIRMAVNREEEELDLGLQSALRLLRPLGRLAVISFHSVEDRWVKRRLGAHIGRMESLQQGGERWTGERPRVARVTRKPETAGGEELEENPRARSAKLRVVERMNEEPA